MNDLISRQAAIKALYDQYHGMISDESLKVYQFIDWLNEVPTAEKQGRWLRPRPVPQVWSLFMADCSECGKITYMGDYCMECGAKMESEG